MTKRIHPSLTESRIIEAIKARETSLENPGFCISCGADHYECEPNARRYECEECGKHTVYGAEELLLLGAYHKD